MRRWFQPTAGRRRVQRRLQQRRRSIAWDQDRAKAACEVVRGGALSKQSGQFAVGVRQLGNYSISEQAGLGIPTALNSSDLGI
eukprot:3410379-Pyramimonas_sp.AAC.1